MAYTALQLITRSYYLSQIVARGLQTVSGEQITDGLELLNDLINFKNTDLRLIPYFVRTTFNAVAGTETYFIQNLLEVDTLTFNIGQVRFSMTEFTRDQYFAISRVDNIQSLPFCYRVERVLGGANIYLYYVPASNYVMNLSAKYALTNLSLTTDMTLYYDTYYIEYLRYALAEYLCCEFGVTFPDESKRKLEEMTKKLMDVSPPDLSVTNESYFNAGWAMDWQVVNLSTGYWPF